MKIPPTRYYGVQYLNIRPGGKENWKYISVPGHDAFLAFIFPAAKKLMQEQSALLTDIRFRIVRLNDGEIMTYTISKVEK